jgi:hypothetical protein
VSAAEQRRRWAYAMISRCARPGPAYGSPEWLMLPDGPEKVAAAELDRLLAIGAIKVAD